MSLKRSRRWVQTLAALAVAIPMLASSAIAGSMRTGSLQLISEGTTEIRIDGKGYLPAPELRITGPAGETLRFADLADYPTAMVAFSTRYGPSQPLIVRLQVIPEGDADE